MTSRAFTTALAALAFGSAVACSDPNITPDAAAPDARPSPGRFSLTWTVNFGASPSDCATVGASLVRVTMRPASGAAGFVEIFDCENGAGVSGLHPADEYGVTFELVTGGGNVAAPPLEGFMLLGNGTETAMPAVTFVVAPD